MVYRLMASGYDEKVHAATGSSAAPSVACRPMVLCFDDLAALEEGEAREYIPKACLEPDTCWTYSRVHRTSTDQFVMQLEKSRGVGEIFEFLLSARRVGDDFYISRYESFPTEWPVGSTPSGRFCAVLRAKRPGPSTQSPPCSQQSSYKRAKAGVRKRFELLPASPLVLGQGPHDNAVAPYLSVAHSWYNQAESGADIRCIEADLPLGHHVRGETSRGKQRQSASVDSDVPVEASYNDVDGAANRAQGATAVGMTGSREGAGDVFVWDAYHGTPPTGSSRKSCASPTTQPTALSTGRDIDGTHRTESAHGSVDARRTQIRVMSEKPAWNANSGCLVMKFERNRVKESSSKNLVIAEAGPEGTSGHGGTSAPRRPALQFGKVTDGVYVLDFKKPFSPLNAFALALSAFAFKV